MRRLLGSDAGMVESKYEMMPFTDSFALLSAALGVVFATMGCVSLHTLTLYLFHLIIYDTIFFKGGYTAVLLNLPPSTYLLSSPSHSRR